MAQDRILEKQADLIFKPPFPTDGLEQMYMVYSSKLEGHAYRMLGARPHFQETAADLAQEVFLKASVALPEIEARVKQEGAVLQVKPWLYRITTNLCFDTLRRRQIIDWQPLKPDSLPFQKQVAPDDPLNDVLRQETRDVVREVLEELHPRERIAMRLFLFENHSTEKVGEEMETSRDGVKQLLGRARRHFRTLYLKRNLEN